MWFMPDKSIEGFEGILEHESHKHEIKRLLYLKVSLNIAYRNDEYEH